MNNNGKRPIGRKKNVTEGGGSVNKRGDGLNSGGSRSDGGGGLRSAGKMSPILIIIIGIVIFFLTRNGGGSNDAISSLLGGGDSGSQSGILDSFLNSPNSSGGGSINTVSENLGVLDRSVSNQARAKRGINAGSSDVTIMVYMCGTDLEAKYGAATSDLQEMMKAKISNNVNLIVETGGCTKWQTTNISAKTNQIYKITSGGMTLAADNLGANSMVDPKTLSDFIKYCKTNYPAGRYELIFWDHGGGSLAGYGYDTKFPGGSMTLDKIETALKNGGCTFDFIGFDACLMATLETALVLEPYSDYLLASEETEPGSGWYYTDWLTAISNNPSIDTLDLGKKIIDDYVRYSPPRQQATLSLVDLAELHGTVPDSFKSFAQSTVQLVKSQNYQPVASARSSVREFAKSSKIDQVDLIQLADKIGTPEGQAFANALKGCVKYNLTSGDMKDCGGISIYFPNQSMSNVNKALQTYDKLNIDAQYSECVRAYSNLELGGQIAAGQTNSLETLFGSFLGNNGGGSAASSENSGNSDGLDIGGLLNSFLGGGGDLSGLLGGKEIPQWVDKDLIKNSAQYYEENRFDPSELVFTDKNGSNVVHLTESQWPLVKTIELNVFMDDGGGYIDLGLDNTFTFDSDGDLSADYDRTWLAINKQVVSYYYLSMTGDESNYVIQGRVPAMLNGQLVDLILQFTADEPNGKVLGARINYQGQGQTDTEAKGLIEIRDGDQIDFICGYYTYDKQFVDNYYLGDALTVSGELTISNVSVGNAGCLAAYRFTDIYNNKYWTPNLFD